MTEAQLDTVLKECKKARRAARKMVALLKECDLDAMRDSWREDFLKTLDDVAMKAYAVRVSVVGVPSFGALEGHEPEPEDA